MEPLQRNEAFLDEQFNGTKIMLKMLKLVVNFILIQDSYSVRYKKIIRYEPDQ